MKLVTFTQAGHTRIGVLEGEQVVDLAAAAPDLPTEMCAFLAAGPAAMEAARAARGPALARSDVHLEAPILRPPKIIAVGLNYADHIAETGRDTPTIPMVFNKQSTSVIGPGAPIHKPGVSDMLDYEGELAMVIGKRCRHVPRDHAAGVIAGYTIVNDVSVRDWQMRVPTMTMGKSFDTHCPMGPAIVTGDEFDPAGHELKTLVNGDLRQHSNTKELVFDCLTLVEHLSTAFTLEPGDVIPTGTPGGVALFMKPQAWMKDGDVVSVEIDGLGKLENPVIDEPDTALY